MKAQEVARQMLDMAKQFEAEGLRLAARTMRLAADDLASIDNTQAADPSDLKSLLLYLQTQGVSSVTLSTPKSAPAEMSLTQALSISSKDDTDSSVQVQRQNDSTWVGVVDGQRFTLTTSGIQRGTSAKPINTDSPPDAQIVQNPPQQRTQNPAEQLAGQSIQ